MQTQAAMSTASTLTKVIAAAIALTIGALLLTHAGAPQAGNGSVSAATPVASAVPASLHDGVDWSRVALTPVSTGATVGAYDR